MDSTIIVRNLSPSGVKIGKAGIRNLLGINFSIKLVSNALQFYVLVGEIQLMNEIVSLTSEEAKVFKAEHYEVWYTYLRLPLNVSPGTL